MKREPRSTPPRSKAVLPRTLLIGALLLSVPATWSALCLWTHLPPLRHVPLLGALLARGEMDDLRAAFSRINTAMPPNARTALALRRASLALADARTGTIEPTQLQDAVAAAARTNARSQLGRLQRAATRMWLLEQADTPIADWWPALRSLLEGTSGADFSHHQAALTRHWAHAYESVGWGPGSAYGLADALVGQPHGPFLQYFAGRLQRVIHAQESAGDAAAAETCRHALQELLRQCVLQPGAEGLRLLAADLLADTLDSDPAMGNDPQRQAIARGLRAWRAAYRETIRGRPTATLDPERRPAVAPLEHERLLSRVALTTWLGSAMVAAALLAIALGWTCFGRRQVTVAGRTVVPHALLVALLVTGTGLVWVHFEPDSVRVDLRGDFSAFRYCWQHPFIAAGATIALILATTLLHRPASGGQSLMLPRLGSVAAGAWLVLAVVLWCSVGAGGLAQRTYERATRMAREDAITAAIGPDAERWPAALRQWEP